MEATSYGPKLSGLVSLLGVAFPLGFPQDPSTVAQQLGVKISCRKIATIRRALSTDLGQLMIETIAFDHQQTLVYVDEAGTPKVIPMAAIPMASAAKSG